jgi:hypothetical protein
VSRGLEKMLPFTLVLFKIQILITLVGRRFLKSSEKGPWESSSPENGDFRPIEAKGNKKRFWT